jgi:hypothetical protein
MVSKRSSLLSLALVGAALALFAVAFAQTDTASDASSSPPVASDDVAISGLPLDYVSFDGSYSKGGDSAYSSYPDASGKKYGSSHEGVSNGDDSDAPRVPLYPAGGLRRSRFDRSGFTLFELNQINMLNLKGFDSHGNGIPEGAYTGDKDGPPTNSGIGVIGSPATGDFGGGPLPAKGTVNAAGTTAAATDAAETVSAAGVNQNQGGYSKEKDTEDFVAGKAKVSERDQHTAPYSAECQLQQTTSAAQH